MRIMGKREIGQLQPYELAITLIISELVTLPMENLENLKFDKAPEILKDTPAFYKGEFEVDEPADTFLRPEGFTKGFITVNGFNIGRYYEVGPQKSFFVPASVLIKGNNEMVVFDSDGAKELNAYFVDQPDVLY